MKKITLKTRDAHDLAMVLESVVNQRSTAIDFKQIVQLQNTVDILLVNLVVFNTEFVKLMTQKSKILKTFNDKIIAFKSEILAGSEKSKKVKEGYLENINAFVKDMTLNAQAEIDKELGASLKKLYDEEGEKETEIEIADEKVKLIVEILEKFGKDFYNNKKKMVEVYQILLTVD